MFVTDTDPGALISVIHLNSEALMQLGPDGNVLRQNKQLLQALNSMSQGLCMFDRDQRLIVCNTRYAALFSLPQHLMRSGTTLREMMAHRLEAAAVPVGDPEVFIRERLAVAASGVSSRHDYEMLDGRVLAVVHEPTPDGGWVATFEDITERKRAGERIEYLATHDSLTGLHNRKAFLDHLTMIMEASGRPPKTAALICIDLDRFKDVNDAYGHFAGDEVLCKIAERLRHCQPESFIARLGGDEFTCLVETAAGVKQINRVARTLIATGTKEVEVGSARVSIGLSAGVAVFPKDGLTPEVLIAHADAALYRAKADGRSTFRRFEAGMDERLREKRTLQKDLRVAISQRRLTLHYQPQANVSGEITGFEALSRWKHPRLGVVPPAKFIPIAEESGLIHELGLWVLQTACEEAASWPNPLRIAVNLSPLQLRGDNLPNIVHSVLLQTGLAPHRLELEVTESGIIEDPNHAIAILRRLKTLGVRLAMDDFGTGYSSLSSLHSFPFDRLKLDRAFVGRLQESGTGGAIVKAVIRLGKSLDLLVTAEGVETRQQLEFLQKEGCDEVQGFLIGKPMPAEYFNGVTGILILARQTGVS
jgi:diguanylate cyclase (GGDEF)-like protein